MSTGNIPPPENQPPSHSFTDYSANTEAYQPGQFQPSSYPPQRRSRRPFKQWYRAQTKTARILLGCLPFYVAFILCIGSMTVYGVTHPQLPAQQALATSVTHNNPTKPALATATPTTLPATLPTATPTTAPSPTPTDTPTPTPSPSPSPTPKPSISLNQAILGGSIHAFDLKLGANNCCYRDEWTPPTGPAVGVWDDSYSGTLDETSMNRVVRIDILPQGSDIWSTSEAATLCNIYLPSDANYQSEYTVPLGNLTQGSVKVYYSASLANVLPAHDFIGKDGNQGVSGTIYVYFDYSYNGGSISIDYCVIGIKGNDVSTP